jgi:hypothetical protein
MALSKANAVLLATIVASMANEATPYHMVTEAEAAKLVKDGLVETNGEIRDGDKIAARATEKGIALNTTENPGTPAAASTSAFAIDDGITMPPSRGGRNRSVYPFEQLAVGQSFHVPASEAKPNPAKSLASTVSSANKRNKKDGGSNASFEVRSVDANDPRGAGARVWRIA